MIVNGVFEKIYILCLPLAVIQLYFFKFMGFNISIFIIFSFLLILPLLGWRIKKIDIYSFGYLFLIFCTFFACLWSPSIDLAMRSIFFIISGFILFCYTRRLMNTKPAIVDKAIKYLCFAIAIHSILVTSFYFSPMLEEFFLYSKSASFFINSNALDLYQIDLTNNVKDPDKAGGFFLNGNTSAILAEVGFYISLILLQKNKSRWLILSVIFNFIGIVCTGSKSALFLAVFSFFLSYLIFPIIYEKSSLIKKQFFIIFYFLLFVVIYFIISSISSFDIYEDGAVNAERRKVIFEFGYAQFLNHPFLGLGFGGWENSFFNYGEGLKNYGLNGNMPAHNYFIIAWSRGGVFLLLASLYFYLLFFYAVKIAYLNINKKTAILFLALLMCLLIHTSVDNVIIYEEIHYAGIFAVLLAWIVYHKKNITVY